MSVIVIGRFKADPADLKKLFAERAADFKAVAEEAKGVGALHHRFGAGDGEVIIVDEWNDAESFQKFFGANTTIPEIMKAANVQGPPDFSFYELLDSPDIF
jgi:quinol monooxygenase YgiN